MGFPVYSYSVFWFSSYFSQCTQLSSLSWHYALLSPFWVRPNSSPPSSIGTPCEIRRVVKKLRRCLSRNALIFGSSVGPSTPWFHDKLLLSPSWFFSPLASLCFSL